jgi:hypothetical protein
MGLSHSPFITTDGLVLCLDAANPRSYPGSGSTWYDLSGNNTNGVLQNSPTFNTDSRDFTFNFDGSNQYLSVNNVPSIMTSDFSCEILAKLNTSTGTQYFFGNWGYLTGGFYFARPGWSLNAFYFAIYDTDSYAATNSGNLGGFELDKYYHLVVTRSGTSMTMYKDGKYFTSFSTPSIYKINRTYIHLHRAGDGATYSYGSTKLFRMYINKALSANEVQRNYLATKSRFGL